MRADCRTKRGRLKICFVLFALRPALPPGPTFAYDKVINGTSSGHHWLRDTAVLPPPTVERAMTELAHSANRLLASLDKDKIAALQPHLKVLELPVETVLFETGDTIKTVYFSLRGVVSVVVDLATGEMIDLP